MYLSMIALETTYDKKERGSLINDRQQERTNSFAIIFKNEKQNLTFRKLASMLLAIALAKSVLPVPGGPYSRTP